jgi:hypothetical protein
MIPDAMHNAIPGLRGQPRASKMPSHQRARGTNGLVDESNRLCRFQTAPDTMMVEDLENFCILGAVDRLAQFVMVHQR